MKSNINQHEIQSKVYNHLQSQMSYKELQIAVETKKEMDEMINGIMC